MDKELEWSLPIPRNPAFSCNNENQRTAFKAVDPRDRDLNLEPAEKKTAGASVDRRTTPFCDAARAISDKKKIPLVGLCLILRCYRNISL
jgi:hypothetical protein